MSRHAHGAAGVSAVGLFAVCYGGAVAGLDGVDVGFPLANADAAQTIERPLILAGRMFDQGRAAPDLCGVKTGSRLGF